LRVLRASLCASQVLIEQRRRVVLVARHRVPQRPIVIEE